MEHRRSLLFLGISLLASAVSAQQLSGQGVLVNGNSQLPACAQTCGLLNQAAQACTATTGTATQADWICFCQSAYLTNLRTSAVGICDSSCTDPTQNAQVSTWYNSNCGSDYGATEHATDATASTGTSTGATANNGATTGSTTNTNTGSSTNGNSAQNINQVGSNPPSNQTWWEGHYKWIIMIIVLAIALSLFAWALTFFKKRHDRNRDKITGCFNAGITANSVFDPEKGSTTIPPNTLHPTSASGRTSSPARTREAFMPYGYGYTSSESRVGSRTEMVGGGEGGGAIPLEEKKSPLAREIPVIRTPDEEKGGVQGLGPWPMPDKRERGPQQQKRGPARGR